MFGFFSEPEMKHFPSLLIDSSAGAQAQPSRRSSQNPTVSVLCCGWLKCSFV